MKQEELVQIAKRLLDHVEKGTTDSHPEGPRRHTVATYTDPGIFALEQERIFRRAPQLVCLSADLPEAGDCWTHDDSGVPILVVRNRDGRLRAFLNRCAHRGARLVERVGEASKRAAARPKLVCPYHAWSYDLDGRCTAIHKNPSFGRLRPEDFSLLELPCQEKYGFVYVAPSPEAGFRIDEHLGELGSQLGSWRLSEVTFVEAHDWELPVNWKLALDTFCEGYHFAPLHGKTVGVRSVTNTSCYERFGEQREHHRLVFPKKAIVELRGLPEEDWDPLRYFSLVHFLSPNVSLLVSANEVELFQIHPGDRVDSCRVRYRSYMRQPLDSPEKWEAARAHARYIIDVVDREDFWVCANVQKGLGGGLARHVHFGANEPALIDMHRSLRRLVGLAPEDEAVPSPSKA